MKFARRLLLLALLLVVPTMVSAQDAASWTGNYQVTGVDLDGTPYEAGLEIVEMAGYTQFMWNYADASSVEIGVGLLLGDGLMAVAYDMTCVIQVFNISANFSSMSGPWAAAFAGLGSETATLTSSTDTLATFDVSGSYPDGTSYAGTLEVATEGNDVYTLTWTLDSETYSGIGIGGDGLLVASADTNPDVPCGVGLMARGDDGSISGIWAVEGDEGTYSDIALPLVLADSYHVTGTTADGATYQAVMNFSGGTSRYTLDINVGGQTASGVGLLRGTILTMVIGGEQCAVVNRALLPTGQLWSETATVANTTIGRTIQTPAGETNGFAGTFDIVGTAATGASTSGTLTLTTGDNEIVTGTGSATRSTGESVDLASIYLMNSGTIAGVYAPGGDVTSCAIETGLVGMDGTISLINTRYGATAVNGREVATPAT